MNKSRVLSIRHGIERRGLEETGKILGAAEKLQTGGGPKIGVDGFSVTPKIAGCM